MKLREWKESKNKNTSKVSDISRQLALAGIAIIWIFKHTQNGKDFIPNELIRPTIFLLTTLFLDIMQYVYLSIFLLFFYRINEHILLKQNQASNNTIRDVSELDVKNKHAWLINISYIPWFFKVVFLLIGYYMIGCYLMKELKI